MKAPKIFPCLMLEKEHAFTNQLTRYAIIRNLRQFFGYKKQFKTPVYTYDQRMLNEALSLEYFQTK